MSSTMSCLAACARLHAMSRPSLHHVGLHCSSLVRSLVSLLRHGKWVCVWGGQVMGPVTGDGAWAPLPLVALPGIGSPSPVLTCPVSAPGPNERELGRGVWATRYRGPVSHVEYQLPQPDHITDFIKSSCIPTCPGLVACILFDCDCTTLSIPNFTSSSAGPSFILSRLLFACASLTASPSSHSTFLVRLQTSTP